MTARSRAVEFGHGVAWNLLGQGLLFAASFALVPFVVKKLGEADYALYSLLGVLSGYISLLTLGAGTTTTKTVSEAAGRCDEAALRSALRRGAAMHGIPTLLGAVVLVVFRRQLAQMMAPAASENLSSLVVACAGMGGVFFSLNQFSTAVFYGLQRFDLLNMSQLAQGSGFLLITAALAAAGHGLREACFAFPLFQAALCAVQLPMCLREALRRTGGKAGVIPPLGAFVRFGLGAFFAQLAWSFTFQLDKVLVVRNLPLEKATYYIIPSFILQKFWMVSCAITMTAFPSISEHAGRGDKAALHRLYSSASRLVLMSILPAFVLLVCLGPQLLTLWMGSDFSLHGTWTLRLLTGGYFFYLLVLMPSTAAYGVGSPRYVVAWGAAQAALTGGAWAYAIPRWGALGAAGGFLFGQAVTGIPFALVVSQRFFDMRPAAYFREVLARPLFAAAVLFCALWPLRSAAWGWPGFIGLSGLSAAGYYLLAYKTLPPEDKAAADSILASLKKRVLG